MGAVNKRRGRGMYSMKFPTPAEKMEYAIATEEMDSLLFEITKFLLQVSYLHCVFIKGSLLSYNSCAGSLCNNGRRV